MPAPTDPPTTGSGNGGSPRRTGIVGSAKRVVAHASSLMQLQRELARAELQRKGASFGTGAALAVAAAILALYALGFGLATLAAALALVVDWWLALLIVFLFLVALVVVLLLVARRLVRQATPLKPEQALEEAQLTKEMLKGARGG